eukprot:jgi/Chlat1/2126/Chrsp17S08742
MAGRVRQLAPLLRRAVAGRQQIVAGVAACSRHGSLLHRAGAAAAAAQGQLRRSISVAALRPLDTFERRHNSIPDNEAEAMAAACGFKSMDALIDATVPANIRREPMELGKYDEGMTESQILACLSALLDSPHIVVTSEDKFDFSKNDVCGVLVQYPATDGSIKDYRSFIKESHAHGVKGKRALRMAMQTREQHIRRDKATSNICTAQALLANMAAMYGVYHGPNGLKDIAKRVHGLAAIFAAGIKKAHAGEIGSDPFFDTVKVIVGNGRAESVAAAARSEGCNLRVLNKDTVTVAFDETASMEDVDALFAVFAGHKVPFTAESLAHEVDDSLPTQFARTSPFLQHDVFNKYHTEHELLRYIKRLEAKDLSLCHSMIPLGSCTMKLNATTEMIPITWPELADMHPFAPLDQTQGYQEMFRDLSEMLCEITGFDSMSLQPNAGAAGEYAGLMAIRAYHQARGDHHRNICIIPTSAHGTNPASAAMCGMRIVTVSSDEQGNVNVAELKEKAKQNAANLAALMVTYPSTHGVYEESIKEICEVIHQYGGQVYMDGANMNAQVGLTSPGHIGADVCHLNLHKTFCIPHGGGGPGMGPIGVKKHLAPFLPSHPVIGTGGWPVPEDQLQPFGTVAAAPWGSALILPISYTYIAMMGSKGLTNASKLAILNANYMAAKLKDHFDVLFTGSNGTCAHEFILDLRGFKATAGIEAEDVAKRLMDYGYHAPTMSWPVAGTLMIEPTESESKSELDRFCAAMIGIRQEIAEIEAGKLPKDNNPLVHAPHPISSILSEEWNRPYSKQKATYPAPWLQSFKFWPTTHRIDNVYGDRHLVTAKKAGEVEEPEQLAA